MLLGYIESDSFVLRFCFFFLAVLLVLGLGSDVIVPFVNLFRHRLNGPWLVDALSLIMQCCARSCDCVASGLSFRCLENQIAVHSATVIKLLPSPLSRSLEGDKSMASIIQRRLFSSCRGQSY